MSEILEAERFSAGGAGLPIRPVIAVVQIAMPLSSLQIFSYF